MIPLKLFKFPVCKMEIINEVSTLTPTPATHLLIVWVKWECELENVMCGSAMSMPMLAKDGVVNWLLQGAWKDAMLEDSYQDVSPFTASVIMGSCLLTHPSGNLDHWEVTA